MNARTKILAGVAALGLAAALVFSLVGGSGADVTKPLRTVSGALSTPAPDGPVKANARSGYDAFRLFHTRNVFDPDRRPPRVASDAPPTATPPPARTDFVALTGTMLENNRSLAFFSGSRAEYNKVLSVRDRIAGAEITQITPISIEIDRAGRKTLVSVGQTVPFDGSAAPGAAPAPETFATAPSTASAAAMGASPGAGSTSLAPAGSPSSSKQDDIRRRLEERRRQEQK